MGEIGDDGLRTVECLRGRLLAERLASKAAKAESDLMAKRVLELERQLAEEMKSMRRAEKRLKSALKKLETLNFLDSSGRSNLSGSSVSSSSISACFSGHRGSEGKEPDLGVVDSGQCCSRGEMGQMPRLSGSEDFIGDYGSGDSSADSTLQAVSQDGSWSSVGTGYSRSEGAPRRDEAIKSLAPHEPVTDAARQPSPISGDELVRRKDLPTSSTRYYQQEIDGTSHRALVTQKS